MKKIVLVSGGLDSFIAYHLFGGTPVFVNYGQKYAEQEKKACLLLYGEALNVLDIAGLPCVTLDKNYIPNRNLLLATLATTFLYPEEIVIAGLKDDNCQDKNPEAFAEYSEILSKYGKKNILVTSPFWQTTKGQAIEMYLSNGGNKDMLSETFSCYTPTKNGSCQDCEACYRKYVALASNGIPTLPISERMKNYYLQNIESYDEERQQRIRATI